MNIIKTYLKDFDLDVDQLTEKGLSKREAKEMLEKMKRIRK